MRDTFFDYQYVPIYKFWCVCFQKVNTWCGFCASVSEANCSDGLYKEKYLTEGF